MKKAIVIVGLLLILALSCSAQWHPFYPKVENPTIITYEPVFDDVNQRWVDTTFIDVNAADSYILLYPDEPPFNKEWYIFFSEPNVLPRIIYIYGVVLGTSGGPALIFDSSYFSDTSLFTMNTQNSLLIVWLLTNNFGIIQTRWMQ